MQKPCSHSSQRTKKIFSRLPFTFLNYPPQTYHPSPEISLRILPISILSHSKTPSPKTSSLLFADVSSSIRADKETSVYPVSELSSSLSILAHPPPLCIRPPFTKTPVILLCEPSNYKLYRGRESSPDRPSPPDARDQLLTIPKMKLTERGGGRQGRREGKIEANLVWV